MQIRTDTFSEFGFWMLVFLFLAIGHSGHPIDSDEGLILHGAWSLWNGHEPYANFFAFIPPGGYYAIYWLWEIFGPYYMVAKAFSVLSLFMGCVGIHLTGRLLASNGLSGLGPLLYALASINWPIINHHIFNIVLVIWATYLCAYSIKSGSISALAPSGLLAGASALFLQHVAAALIGVTAMFLLFLWHSEKRKVWLKGFALYLACAAAPMLIFLKWPLDLLFQDLVLFPLFRYVPHAAVAFWPFYIACGLLLGGMALLRGANNRVATFLAVVQAALLFTSLQRTDFMHVSITLAPLMALLPYLSSRATDLSLSSNLFPVSSIAKLVRLQSWWPSLLVLLFRSAVAFMALIPLTIAIAVLMNSHTHFFGKRAAPGLIEYLNEHCAESPYLYAGPFLPGLAYETRKLDATSFDFLITGLHTPEQFEQAMRELKLHKPECVVTNYAMVEKLGYKQNNPVDEFIKANYRSSYKYGSRGIEVYVLKP